MITIWSDVACPWATLAVLRVRAARERLALVEQVPLRFRAFPLELFNERPTPRLQLDAEVGALARLAPEFGWQVWQADPSRYPGTVLLALEAVQAAQAQSAHAAEELDAALRRALFAESRSIGMRHEVLAAARTCDSVDVDALERALDDGSFRGRVVGDWREARDAGVRGSPHLFLPDGTDAHNPGVEHRWVGESPAGFPLVERDDPGVYDDLVRRAAAST